MKVNPKRPLEHKGEIMTAPYETTEVHARQLSTRGFADIVESDDKSPPKRTRRKSKKVEQV